MGFYLISNAHKHHTREASKRDISLERKYQISVTQLIHLGPKISMFNRMADEGNILEFSDFESRIIVKFFLISTKGSNWLEGQRNILKSLFTFYFTMKQNSTEF